MRQNGGGSGGHRVATYSPINNYNKNKINFEEELARVEEGDGNLSPNYSHFDASKNFMNDERGKLREEFNEKQNTQTQSKQLISDSNLPEEVYVYNCCGLTNELNPTIKFMSTFKCVFTIFNLLVFAFGLANFGMGLWFRIDPKVYEIHKYIETQNFTYAGWIILTCGFLSCLIALLGFIAIASKSICLITFYVTVLILSTIAFVGTLVLLTVYGLGITLEQFIVKEVYEQMRRRAMNADLDSFVTSDAAQFMDFIQVKMRCCGATDFRDYLKLGMTIPTTCYTIDKNYVGAPGCGRAIRLLLDIRAGMATGFTCGSVVSQLAAIIASSLILCSIYHWRANPRPRPVVKTATQEDPKEVLYSAPNAARRPNSAGSQLAESTNNANALYNLKRPRSRTPIVI